MFIFVLLEHIQNFSILVYSQTGQSLRDSRDYFKRIRHEDSSDGSRDSHFLSFTRVFGFCPFCHSLFTISPFAIFVIRLYYHSLFFVIRSYSKGGLVFPTTTRFRFVYLLLLLISCFVLAFFAIHIHIYCHSLFWFVHSLVLFAPFVINFFRFAHSKKRMTKRAKESKRSFLSLFLSLCSSSLFLSTYKIAPDALKKLFESNVCHRLNTERPGFNTTNENRHTFLRTLSPQTLPHPRHWY